jgi:predicted aspartyl protease
MQVRFAISDSKFSSEETLGIVDTGADATIVPLALLEQIEATIEGYNTMRGHWGESRPVNLYNVDVVIEGVTLPGILVIGDEVGHEVILGRDVLNRLQLLLDGLKLHTELVGY